MKLVKDLPAIFDAFGQKRKESFLEIKEYKEKGYPIIGMYCAYFPVELAMAIGAIPVGLCSFSEETIPAAEREMPKSMCPLVKSSYGYALEDKCPLFHFSDLVIGETTCDGKKKMFELMSEIKNVHVMNLPNSPTESGKQFWRSEVVDTAQAIEECFGRTIEENELKNAIRLGNDIRKSLLRLCEVMKLEPAPVLGKDIQKIVTGCKYRFDFKTTPQVVDEITDRILEEYKQGKMLEHRPRILLTGCPIGTDTMKLFDAIEDNGGVVVAVENCSGVKTLDRMIDEENPDLYGAIADRYIATGCSIMTPNDNRIDLLGKIIDEYQVDGVVEMILRGCHSTGAESVYIRKFVTEEKKLPYLAVETDYSQNDVAQIGTRISAMLEMIQEEQKDGKLFQMEQCYQIMLTALKEKASQKKLLEKISAYTELPLRIRDEAENVLLSAGDFVLVKNIERLHMTSPGGGVLELGYNWCPKRVRIELLELLAKGLQLCRDDNPLHEMQKAGGKPYYCWIFAELPLDGEALSDILRDHAQILEIRKTLDYEQICLSNIPSSEEHEKIVSICKEFNWETQLYMEIGNLFESAEKKEENFQMLRRVRRLRERGTKVAPVARIESYYRELVIDCALEEAPFRSEFIPEIQILKEDDEKNQGSLYETCYYYLLNRRNASQTAAHMKVHRNTMLYRINKINELVNIAEKSNEEAEMLLMAMQIERMSYID